MTPGKVGPRRASNLGDVRRAAVSAAVAGLLLGATAHAGAPAAPTMTAVRGTQRGAPVYTTVHRSHGGGVCSSMHADYVARYPDAIGHDGSPVSWRVTGQRRPARVSVTLWRLGTDQAAAGVPEAVPVTLTPVRSGSRTVAWTVRSGELGYGDLHLDLTVVWPKGPCGADDGRYRYRLLSLPS